MNRVASATAAARRARRRSPGPLPPLATLNWQQGRGAPPARQRSTSQGQLAAAAAQMAPSTPRGSAETITAAQRLAAISPGPSTCISSAPGSPSALAGSHAPGWLQPPAWAAAAPGSPRAVRSSAPARPASWQRQAAALEALTGTHSPRAARGGGEASAEGPEWVPGSPRSSLQRTPDPELQSVRRTGPSRLAAVGGSEAAAMAPDLTPASGSTLGGSSKQPAGQPLPPDSERSSAEAAAPEAAASGGEEEQDESWSAEAEEEAAFPEDPGMQSFSSQVSAAAAPAPEPSRGAPPDACTPPRAASGQTLLLPQPRPISVEAAGRPRFPEDSGDGKSGAPHALRQLSPSVAWAAAEGTDAGSPPATPAPGTPRKKRGGLFSALNRILRF